MLHFRPRTKINGEKRGISSRQQCGVHGGDPETKKALCFFCARSCAASHLPSQPKFVSLRSILSTFITRSSESMLLSNRLTASILAPTRRLALLAAHHPVHRPLSVRNLTMSTHAPYSRLIRFHPYITHKLEFGKPDILDEIRIGEPVDASLDVGELMYRGFSGDPNILINVYSGTSILSPASLPVSSSSSASCCRPSRRPK